MSVVSRPALLLCALGLLAPTVRAQSVEQTLAGVDAVIQACVGVQPAVAKAGQEWLVKESFKRGWDLAALRRTPGYRSAYNAEVNRLLALSAQARAMECRSAF